MAFNDYKSEGEPSGQAMVPKADSATVAMVTSRQAQEIQSAMVIAKRFPRDEIQALNRILKACRRPGLADQAEYEYPRGDGKVTGPSIRLAESIAQNWGNVDFGIIELDNSRGQSQMMAYAWDLETNTRVTKVFSVRHVRDTKRGSYNLTDSRDIYEATANFGSRRVRACILGIIPGDVVDAALQECHKTLAGQNKTPIEDRVAKMIIQFDKELQVSQAMIEKYLGCNVKAFSEKDLKRMANIYRSIADGMSSADDYFRDQKAPETGADFKSPFPAAEQPKTQATPAPDPDAELRARIERENPGKSEWEIDDLIEAEKNTKKAK